MIFGSSNIAKSAADPNKSIFGSILKPQTSSASLFGATANTGSIFGATPSAAPTGTSMFGQSTTQAAAAGFGISSGGIFGGSATVTGESKPKTQEEEAKETDARLIRILNEGKIYGDSRDESLRKFNIVQIVFGFGQAVESITENIDIEKSSNVDSQFKSYVYNTKNCHASYGDEIICLVFELPYYQIALHKQAIKSAIEKILEISNDVAEICLASSYCVSDNQSAQTFYIKKKGTALDANILDEDQRVSADFVVEYLNKINAEKPTALGKVNPGQEELKKLNLKTYYAQRKWTVEEIKSYQKMIPLGFSSKLWDVANNNNPDPGNLLPFPLSGFEELRNRLTTQRCQMQMRDKQIQAIMCDLYELTTSCAAIKIRLGNLLRWKDNFSHRLLSLSLSFELRRRGTSELSLQEQNLRDFVNKMIDFFNKPGNGLSSRIQVTQKQIVDKDLEKLNKPTRLRDKIDESSRKETVKSLFMIQDAIESLNRTITASENRLRKIGDDGVGGK